MFSGFYVEATEVVNGSLMVTRSAQANIMAAQILWRVATYHLVVICAGFVAATYHSRPKETFSYANRQTFVNLQLETYAERKHSADTMFETRQLSRAAVRKQLLNDVKADSYGLETGDDYIVTDLPTKRKKK